MDSAIDGSREYLFLYLVPSGVVKE